MKKSGYLYFAVPTVLLSAIILFYPLGYAFWTSFFSYYLPVPSLHFVGLENYISTILSADLHRALAVTVSFTAGAVCVELVFGFMIAAFLNKIEVARRALTTIIFLPHMITPVVIGLILKWMFIPEWGMVNYVLGLLGIKGPAWLSHPFYALLAVLLADVWQNTPFIAVVLLAGFQALPQEPIEAAVVDGASGFRMLWHIILPLFKPLILFIAIIRTMDAFRLFDKVYVMTGGGPGTATEMITVYNYRLTFKMLQIGKGAAVAVWTLIFLLGTISVYLYLLYKSE